MKKNRITNLLYWAILAGLALYFAYSKGWIAADFESVTPQQAYTLLQNDANVTLLDVRTPQEFSQEHIEGATLIPVDTLEASLEGLDHAKKIVVYCASGNRSVAASRILANHGFTPLNVKGGIGAWQSEGLPIAR